jgi:hypothetical protein
MQGTADPIMKPKYKVENLIVDVSPFHLGQASTKPQLPKQPQGNPLTEQAPVARFGLLDMRHVRFGQAYRVTSSVPNIAKLRLEKGT